MNNRLINEAGESIARKCLGIIAPLLRPEEERDAFVEFYEVATLVLAEYHRQVRRMDHQLGHSWDAARAEGEVRDAG